MNRGHTPGPWKVTKAPENVRADFTICAYTCSPIADMLQGHDALDNARLMAAAPDLLDALVRIVEWQSRPMDSGLPAEPGITGAQIEQAMAAIAKATQGERGGL